MTKQKSNKGCIVFEIKKCKVCGKDCSTGSYHLECLIKEMEHTNIGCKNCGICVKEKINNV